MNLKPLFELQNKLDERIVKEKGLEGQDLLPKKILALQVELGELANEWRGFKFWSNNQKPNHRQRLDEETEKEFVRLYGWSPNDIKSPLLEEYVDCLHFILSIGLELNIEVLYADENQSKRKDIIGLFRSLFICSGVLGRPESEDEVNYLSLMSQFIRLGQLLGFTWEQIEQAYMDKNKVNHERQNNGY